MFRSFLPFAAPGEYFFTDPDTGHTYYASSRPELLEKILSYREQNGLPDIFQLGAVVDNFLCSQPQNIGKCGKNPTISRSWWTSIKGGVTILVNMVIKNPVKQAVADARAEQCVKCPHNYFPDKKQFIKWSDRVAEAAVPGKKSRLHNQLGNCSVCTCPLRAKVFAPGPFSVKEEEREEMAKVGCWQLKE